MTDKDPENPLQKGTKRKLSEGVKGVEDEPLKAQEKEVTPETGCPGPDFADLTAEESAAFIQATIDAEVVNQKNTWIEENSELIVQVENALIEFARQCDESVNKEWDAHHGKGAQHTDCLNDKATGETMQQWNKEKEVYETVPKPIQVKLGELKEACVNTKARAIPEIKQQVRFHSDGTFAKNKYDKQRGDSVPDYILVGPPGGSARTPADRVYAVFDLKSPCPSEERKPGQWKDGQAEKYFKVFKVAPTLVYPAKDKQ